MTAPAPSHRHNAEFLSRAALEALGFAALGQNVLIHASCVLLGCDRISLGDNVRIDPFTLVSAAEPVSIGPHVHIATGARLFGGAGLTMQEFSAMSSGAAVFSASDDYRGAGLIGPTVPAEFRNVHEAPVVFERFTCLGAHAVALPGSVLREGATVGALSLAKGELAAWMLHAGVPARVLAPRDRDGVLAAAARFRASSSP